MIGEFSMKAIHTSADCLNQILLLIGLRQAKAGASEKHPLGTGRASYFWSFIVALMLFFGGGVFSIGEGFEKIVCCDHALTEEDLVPDVATIRGRKKGGLPPAVVLDEKKLYPDSCGLRVMIIDGGAGFTEIRCCGHSLTASSMRELQFGGMRGSEPDAMGPPGTA